MASQEIQDLAQSIASAIQGGQPAKKMTFGEYTRKTTSIYKPNGIYNGVKLKRQTFQNGIQIPVDRVHDDDIRALNKLHRGGRYLDRFVELVFGNTEGDAWLDIRYKNKGTDARIEQAKRFVDFSDLCKKLLAEQTALDLRDGIVEEEQTAQRRQFGSSKATQEAYAKAAENTK